MEIEQFQEILAGFVTADQVQDSTEIIQNLIDTKYSAYIELLMNTIQQIDNQQIFDVSVMLMDNEVKKKRIFQDPDLAVEIISGLTPIVANILQSPDVKDNFKDIMAYILAQSHIFIYHCTNSIDIPQYILTVYSQMPEIRKYLIYCLFEISFNDEDYGGFNVEDLITIVIDSSEDESVYIPKLNLFFSIAMRNLDNEDLQKISLDLLVACPESELKKMLHSLSSFAEKSAMFFQPFLESLVQRLCEIALNSEYEDIIRDLSMNCLTSIAEGAPGMCQSNEEYYAPVFKTFIQIASEIDDDSPWEYDLNNTQPYQYALDSIAIIFEKFQSPNIFVPIFDMIMEVLSQDEIPWQTAYASISALAEINYLAMENIFASKEEVDVQKNLYERLAGFLDISCHPRTRIAVYNFIWKLSQHLILYPIESEKNPYSNILIMPLEVMMINEDNLIAKKISYQAYNQFISQSVGQKTVVYLERFYPQLVNELRTLLAQDPENPFIIYIVRLIGPIVKLARDGAVSKFQDIFAISCQLLQSRDTNIRAEAIRCFALACLYLPKKKKDVKTKLINICFRFLVAGFNLLKSEIFDEDSLDHLYEAIYNLIGLVGSNVEPLIPHEMPKILADCQKEITIEETNPYGDNINETLNMKSVYLLISPENSLIKQYAAKNEVTEVEHGLLILDAFICCNDFFHNYINDIYAIIENWITNRFSIQPIQEKCWTILDHLNRIFQDNFDIESQKSPEEQEQMEGILQASYRHIQFLLHCFICNIEKHGKPMMMCNMIKVTSSAISYATQINWMESELFESILQILFPFINYIFECKEKTIKTLEEFTTVDLSDKEIAHYDNCLGSISDLISNCFKLQPEITNEFYCQTILPKTEDYLQNDLTLIFGVTITTCYIIHSKDFEKMISFSDTLMKFALSFERQDDLSLYSLLSIGRFLFEFQLPDREVADSFFNFFDEFFKLDQIQSDQSDNMTMISDFANVAFAKFIMKNKQYFDPAFITNSFIDAGPLWEECEDSDIYFQCMIEFLNDGSYMLDDVYGNEWAEVLLSPIITGYMTHLYGERTREKFAETINKIYATDEGKQAINAALERVEVTRAAVFMDLVSLERNIDQEEEEDEDE